MGLLHLKNSNSIQYIIRMFREKRSSGLARFMWPLVPSWFKPSSSLTWITVKASNLVFLLPSLVPNFHCTWKCLITSHLCSKPSNGFPSWEKAKITIVAYKVLHNMMHSYLSDLISCHLLAHTLHQPPWLFAALWSCLICSCLIAYATQYGYGGICRVHPHLTQVCKQTLSAHWSFSYPKIPNSLPAFFFMALSLLKITYLNYLISITWPTLKIVALWGQAFGSALFTTVSPAPENVPDTKRELNNLLKASCWRESSGASSQMIMKIRPKDM